MRKFLALLALVASLTVTACGGDDAPPTMMPPPMDGDSGTVTPPTPPPGTMGTIVLAADVDGMVQIDGMDVMQLAVGQMPWRWEVPAGTHSVTVTNPGYVATTWVDDVAAGQDRTVEVRMGPAVDDIIFLCERSPSSRQAVVRVHNEDNVVRIGGIQTGSTVFYTMRGDTGTDEFGTTVQFAPDHLSYILTYVTDPLRPETCRVQ